jgi:DNA-binding transcriptional MerR regulator
LVKVKGYYCDVFKIASFARLGGVSSKVLRDYDKLGIFRPAWIDRETGYRLYTPAQLPDLRRILALRDLGVGLAEIRAHLVEGSNLRAVLERRRDELEAARREVDRRLASLGLTAELGANVVLRVLPRDLVATFDVAATDGDEGRAFYELELVVRDAGVRAQRPPGTLFSPESVEVYVPVRRAAPTLNARRLEPMRAATILHHGSYATFDRTRRELDEWIAASGLQPTGDYRIVYLQFGAEEDLRLPAQYLVERSSDLVTELQVPVTG